MASNTNDTSFLWLKRSKSSLGADQQRSSWTTNDSDNSVSLIAVSNPPQPHTTMSSPSSSIPLRKQPSLQSHATSRLHGASGGDTTQSSPSTHPAPLSSPVPNRSHPQSASESTSTSAQRASMGSPRTHPYQLAAYDSANYRVQESIESGPPSRIISTSYNDSSHFRPIAPSSKEASAAAQEKDHLSPRIPNTSLPTNPLLSDKLTQKELDNRRNQRRNTAQRRASLASLRILNNYPVPSAPKTPRFGISSIPQLVMFFSAALLLPIILAVIYMPIGHSILKLSRKWNGLEPPSIYALAGLRSSVKAGAVGGAILAFPILLVLYLLGLFPTSVSKTAREANTTSLRPTQQAGDDFFEDSDTESMKNLWNPRWLARCASIAFVVLLVLSIGGIAGPLGATALSSSSGDPWQDAKLGRIEVYLTPGAASAAGMAGGCLVIGGLLIMGLLTAATMVLFSRLDSRQIEV